MKSYRPYAPGQAFLLPPSPNEWLPEDHLAYFVLDLLADMDLAPFERSLQMKDARGERPFAPRMMLALLVYGGVDGSLIPSRFDADVDRHVRRGVEERAVFIDSGDARADRWTSASSSI